MIIGKGYEFFILAIFLAKTKAQIKVQNIWPKFPELSGTKHIKKHGKAESEETQRKKDR